SPAMKQATTARMMATRVGMEAALRHQGGDRLHQPDQRLHALQEEDDRQVDGEDHQQPPDEGGAKETQQLSHGNPLRADGAHTRSARQLLRGARRWGVHSRPPLTLSTSSSWFGRYRLTSRIATGGMAEVYLGRALQADGRFGPAVAGKRLLPRLTSAEASVRVVLNQAESTRQSPQPNLSDRRDH